MGEGSTRSGRCSTDAPMRSSGVAGTARHERNALNTGDLDRMRVATATGRHKAAAEAVAAGEESDGP